MTAATETAACRRQLAYVRSIGIGLTLLWGVAVLDFYLLVSHLSPNAVDGRWFLLLWLLGTAWLALAYSRFFERERRLGKAVDREAALTSMAREEKSFLVSVLDAISQPTVVIRTDYSMALLNREARKQHLPEGHAHGALPKCYKLLHHLDRPCSGADHPCPLTRVMHTGRPTHVVHRHYKGDGSVAFVELEASPITGDAHHTLVPDTLRHLRVIPGLLLRYIIRLGLCNIDRWIYLL